MAHRQPRLLVIGLSVVVLTVAVLQTAVVPVLGVIADQLGASVVAATDIRPEASSHSVPPAIAKIAAATPMLKRRRVRRAR